MDIDSFLKKLDELNTLKVQIEVKLQGEIERAEEIKRKLKEKGYQNLNEAIEDYNSRSKNILEQERKLDALLEKIKNLEFKQPSREEIFSLSKIDTVKEEELSEYSIDTSDISLL